MKRILPILICLLFTITELDAQWVQTDGPYGGNVKAIAVSGSNVFVGIGGGAGGTGVFLSTNNGASWKPVNNGLPQQANVYALAVKDTYIYAGINGGGVYRTSDNGANWIAVNKGLPSHTAVFSLAVSGNNIFAATVYSGGVYRSTDNGSSWTAVNTGLPQNPDPNNPVYDLDVITADGNNIFLGTSIAGLFRTTDNGEKWIYCGFKDTTIFSITVSGTNIFAGTKLCGNRFIFRSSDNGKSWNNVDVGMSGLICTALAGSGKYIFAGTSTGGVFRSDDNGTTWTQVNNGLPTNYWVYSLAVFPNGIGGLNVLVGNNRGVYLSANNCESWTEVDSGLAGTRNRALAVSGTNLFAGTNSGVFLSTNNGANWIAVNNGLSSYSVLDAQALAILGTNLYAAIIPYGDPPFGNGLCLTTDTGTNWIRLCSSPPGGQVTAIAVDKNVLGIANIFAGTVDGIFRSTDNGTNWTKLSLPQNCLIYDIKINETSIFVTTNITGSNVFYSSDKGSNWYTINGFPDGVQSLSIFGSNIFVTSWNGVYLSTDNGKKWTQVNSGLPSNVYPISIAVSTTHVFVLDYFFDNVWMRPLSEMIPSIWQTDITIKDKGNVSQILSFGKLPTAIDGIDSDLEEAPLPPAPFGFDARFHLPTGDDSWKDFRSTERDSAEWLIKFQPGAGGYPITFLWDNTKLPNGNFNLRDAITGSIVNVNMKSNSSYTLTNTGINALKIVTFSATVPLLPTKPVLVSPSTNQINQPRDITFKWNKAKDSEKYFIQLSEDQEFSTIAKSDSTTTDTVKVLSNLSEGQKYFWKVLGKNSAGISPWSDIWNFTTQITPPSNLTLQRTGLKEITLKWNDNSNNEEGCLIERKQLPQTNYSFLDSLKTTAITYLDNKVDQGPTYSYRIKAYTKFAESSYSNEASIIVVGVEEEEMPTEYSLAQNYPNPFNPSTKIKFGLPENAIMKLIVYDILGREISILVNQELDAGYHEVNFDASNLSSGIYFYRIVTPNFTSVKKLLLMK